MASIMLSKKDRKKLTILSACSKYIFTCTACKTYLVCRYHCDVCEDFNFCNSCYSKEDHIHPMRKLGLDELASQSNRERITSLLRELEQDQNIRRRIGVMGNHEIPLIVGQNGADAVPIVRDQYIFCCKVCESFVETRYHWYQFGEDFDLCVECYSKKVYNNPLHTDEVLPTDEASSNSEAKQASVHSSLKLAKLAQDLQIASHCGVADCCIMSCRNMKKFIAHVRQCKTRECGACKQFKHLVFHHAASCSDSKCPVFLCSNMRKKFQQYHIPLQKPPALSVLHSTHCKFANCLLPKCLNKRFTAHVKLCRKKFNENCSLCKQLVALVLHHSKACQERSNCPVLYCVNVRIKLAWERVQRKVILARNLCRQVHSLRNRRMQVSRALRSFGG